MPYTSPLDYLTAFALAFAGGALCSFCLCQHTERVRKGAHAHA